MKPVRKKKKKPHPLKGQVIATSTVSMVGMMSFMAVLGVAGLVLVIGGLVASWGIWSLLGGVVLLLFSAAGIAMAIYQMSVKERLFIGTDRFQIVHQIKGEDLVITQVRYSNIDSIILEQGGQKNYVGINVANLDDPDAYQADDNFETTKSVNGYHCLLYGGYTESLATIYEILRAKVAEENER